MWLPLQVSLQMSHFRTQCVRCTRDLERLSAPCSRIHYPYTSCAHYTSCARLCRAAGGFGLQCAYILRSACNCSPHGYPGTFPFRTCDNLLTPPKRSGPVYNARTTCGPWHSVRQGKTHTQTHSPSSPLLRMQHTYHHPSGRSLRALVPLGRRRSSCTASRPARLDICGRPCTLMSSACHRNDNRPDISRRREAYSTQQATFHTLLCHRLALCRHDASDIHDCAVSRQPSTPILFLRKISSPRTRGRASGQALSSGIAALCTCGGPGTRDLDVG